MVPGRNCPLAVLAAAALAARLTVSMFHPYELRVLYLQDPGTHHSTLGVRVSAVQRSVINETSHHSPDRGPGRWGRKDVRRPQSSTQRGLGQRLAIGSGSLDVIARCDSYVLHIISVTSRASSWRPR
ncbi:hypothetical protein V8E36_008662 [Tilletia maclaganii]